MYVSDLGTEGNHSVYVWEDQSPNSDGRDKEAQDAFQRTFMLNDVRF